MCGLFCEIGGALLWQNKQHHSFICSGVSATVSSWSRKSGKQSKSVLDLRVTIVFFWYHTIKSKNFNEDTGN